MPLKTFSSFFLSSSIPRLCSLTWQSSQGVVSFLPKQGQTDNGTYKKFSQSSFKKLFHFYEKYRSGQLSRYMYLYVIPGSMLTAFIMKPTFVVFVLSLCCFLEKNTCSVILKQIHTQHTGFFYSLPLENQIQVQSYLVQCTCIIIYTCIWGVSTCATATGMS